VLNLFFYLNSLHPLSEEVQGAIANIVKLKELRKGQVWLQEGGICDKMTFVDKGLLKLSFEMGSKELVVNFAKENEIIIETSSYFRQLPSEHSIRAIEQTSVYYFHLADWKHLQQRFDCIDTLFQKLYALQWQQEQVHTAILLLPPKARFQKIAKMYPWMTDGHRLSDKMLAAFIGVAPNAVCNYRKEFH
jgi:CRP-like cAMP-binding protein